MLLWMNVIGMSSSNRYRLSSSYLDQYIVLNISEAVWIKPKNGSCLQLVVVVLPCRTSRRP